MFINFQKKQLVDIRKNNLSFSKIGKGIDFNISNLIWPYNTKKNHFI